MLAIGGADVGHVDCSVAGSIEVTTPRGGRALRPSILKYFGRWKDSLSKFGSKKGVVGEAFRMPNPQEGDKDKKEHYPFLWRDMKLDNYQFFLKKKMFDFNNMGVCYCLNYHTSPKAALHFCAYIKHSKRVPTAPNSGASFFQLRTACWWGVSFSTHKTLKACTTEMASLWPTLPWRS